MRISALSVGLLALLTPLTSAWSKEDHEIFRVRDELIAHEGADVTFYDFIGVTPSATLDEVNKAYRKKSRSLHPDKVKQQLAAERARKPKSKKPGVHVAKPPSASEVRAAVKKASERQARLSIVTNILRGAERDRYDYFLANGFPVWKGTGYYYNRYRPGLGTVMAGLFVFVGGGAHYLALYMAWKRQREFVERYIRFARHAAWGDNLGVNVPGLDTTPAAVPPPQPQQQPDDQPPAPANRRQRRMQERDAKRDAARETGGGGRRARRAGAAGAVGSGAATPTPAQPTSAGPTGPKKRVVAENGKVLVVDSLGDVYLEQEDEDGKMAEFLLDPNEIAAPTYRDTAVYRLPLWLFNATVGRVLPSKKADSNDDDDDFDSEEDGAGEGVTAATAAADDDDSEPGKATPSTDSNEEFEMLEKSTDSLGQAKTTGSQVVGAKGKSNNNRRKGRKK